MLSSRRLVHRKWQVQMVVLSLKGSDRDGGAQERKEPRSTTQSAIAAGVYEISGGGTGQRPWLDFAPRGRVLCSDTTLFSSIHTSQIQNGTLLQTHSDMLC